MASQIETLKAKYKSRQPHVCGATVVEIFGPAAFESWEGAIALIDAYLELERETGEPLSRGYVTKDLYLAIKGYWATELGQDLLKLDSFLAKVSSRAT